MKHIRFFLGLCCLISLMSCDKGIIMDRPEIHADKKTYTISAEGGELLLPIRSTGVDKVEIPENAKSWISHKETIETKALLVFDEDVHLDILPNSSPQKRKTEIKVYSFTKSVKIKIEQEGSK